MSSWDMPTEKSGVTLADMTLTTLRVDVIDGPDKGSSTTSSSDVLTVGTAPGNTLQVTDTTVSRYHLELRRHENAIAVTDLGSTNGTSVSGALIDKGRVFAGAQLKLGNTTIAIADGARAAIEMSAVEHGGLKGQTVVMRRLNAMVDKVARSDVAVLIAGESGTGKELIARAIHATSDRRDEPFVTVDCGALSETLIGSELFGHERGAFTGAADRHSGAFERAGAGSVFLDEIGELPPQSQAMLLGVLERGTYRRLGGRVDLPLRARVISATNRDLRAEVNRNSFRLDLYYRLAIVVLQSPALRDRRQDIPLLVEHFLKQSGHTGPREAVFDDATLASMAAYAWPGNVRELRNLVSSAVVLGSDWTNVHGFVPTTTTPSKSHVRDHGHAPNSPLLPYNQARAALVDEFEYDYLTRLNEQCGGNVSKAARVADMDRGHLTALLRKHGIK